MKKVKESMTLDLKGIPEDSGPWVWVIRPAGQLEALCEALLQEGLKPWALPLVRISYMQVTSSHVEFFESLQDDDYIIVTSANAVPVLQHAESTIRVVLPEAGWCAVGHSTAQALCRATRVQHCVAPEKPGGKHLMALPMWHDVAGKRVTVLKGYHDSTLIEDTLSQQGAEVRTRVLYQRRPLRQDPTPLLHQLQHHQVRGMVITSTDQLGRLFAILSESVHARVRALPTVVLGDGLYRKARAQGFQLLEKVYSASSADIIPALKAVMAMEVCEVE